MDKLLVNKIIPFSFVDGPGNRTAVFSQGCNLDCTYCHNPETINICNNCGYCVDMCPSNSLMYSNGSVIWNSSTCTGCDSCIAACSFSSSPKVKLYTIDELVEEVLKYSNYTQGVTLSGGECTLNIGFLTGFFARVKSKTYTTFVDTNGYIDFSLYPDFLENTDKFMLDIKAWNADVHLNLTGKSNKTILDNFIFLASIGRLHEVRSVIFSGHPDAEIMAENIGKIIDGREIIYKLIKYRPFGTRSSAAGLKTPSDEYMEMLKRTALDNGASKVVIV